MRTDWDVSGRCFDFRYQVEWIRRLTCVVVGELGDLVGDGGVVRLSADEH